jgi:hypothetical protein
LFEFLRAERMRKAFSSIVSIERLHEVDGFETGPVGAIGDLSVKGSFGHLMKVSGKPVIAVARID